MCEWDIRICIRRVIHRLSSGNPLFGGVVWWERETDRHHYQNHKLDYCWMMLMIDERSETLFSSSSSSSQQPRRTKEALRFISRLSAPKQNTLWSGIGTRVVFSSAPPCCGETVNIGNIIRWCGIFRFNFRWIARWTSRSDQPSRVCLFVCVSGEEEELHDREGEREGAECFYLRTRSLIFDEVFRQRLSCLLYYVYLPRWAPFV